MLYLHCVGVEVLTSTEDIVGQWKEYFKDLLNPTETLGTRGMPCLCPGKRSRRQLKNSLVEGPLGLP